MSHVFVLLIWLRATPGATLMYSPNTYKSLVACERAATKVREHFNKSYDPNGEYSAGNSVDTLCLE